MTIDTCQREPLFGEIRNGIVGLNDAGCAVWDEWLALTQRFPTVRLDAFIVMPDHVHGIIILGSGTPAGARTGIPPSDVGALLAAPDIRGTASGAPTPPNPRAPALGQILRAFKSLSAIRVNRLLGRSGPVWQRQFYDRIIRDEREWGNARWYIATNPRRPHT